MVSDVDGGFLPPPPIPTGGSPNDPSCQIRLADTIGRLDRVRFLVIFLSPRIQTVARGTTVSTTCVSRERKTALDLLKYVNPISARTRGR